MRNFIDKRALCLVVAFNACVAGCGAAPTSSTMPESRLTTMAAGTSRTWLATVVPCAAEHTDWLEAEVLMSSPCTRMRCDNQCCNRCHGEMLIRTTVRGSPSRTVQTRLVEELGTSQLECELSAVNQVIRNVHYRVNQLTWTSDALLTTEDLCQIVSP